MSVDGLQTFPLEDLPAAPLNNAQLEAVFQINDWLLGDARRLDTDPNAILAGLCERMNQADIPLDRASSIVELRNAEAHAVSRTWRKGEEVGVYLFSGAGVANEDYDASPFALAHGARCWVLSDLERLPRGHFATLNDLADQGYRHHLVVPVILTNGMNNAFTFVSKAERGFGLEELTMIRRVMPVLGALQEILAINRVLHEAMRMYVGDEPHRRILAGDARRGDVSELRAAIMFTDMRNFTATTARMTPQETTALLNRYYDCIVGPVEAAGGEVLKLIADGVLAIFPADDANENEVCAHALEAARTALLAVVESGNSNSDGPDFRAGIGLHIGQVAYGNVGSGQRLDYTVIGRDVNIGARIAGQCGPLEQSLLLSGDFIDRLSDEARREAVSVGMRDLKGVPDPIALFALSNG